jgi:hypothetical protein
MRPALLTTPVTAEDAVLTCSRIATARAVSRLLSFLGEVIIGRLSTGAVMYVEDFRGLTILPCIAGSVGADLETGVKLKVAGPFGLPVASDIGRSSVDGGCSGLVDNTVSTGMRCAR